MIEAVSNFAFAFSSPRPLPTDVLFLVLDNERGTLAVVQIMCGVIGSSREGLDKGRRGEGKGEGESGKGNVMSYHNIMLLKR